MFRSLLPLLLVAVALALLVGATLELQTVLAFDWTSAASAPAPTTVALPLER